MEFPGWAQAYDPLASASQSARMMCALPILDLLLAYFIFYVSEIELVCS